MITVIAIFVINSVIIIIILTITCSTVIIIILTYIIIISFIINCFFITQMKGGLEAPSPAALSSGEDDNKKFTCHVDVLKAHDTVENGRRKNFIVFSYIDTHKMCLI